VLALLAALGGCGPLGGGDDGDGATDAGPAGGDGGVLGRRRVILVIGDGMGPGQIEAARRFRGGDGGALAMASLPIHASIATASLSGITDSAAAATTMATGVPTLNGAIGIGPDGAPRQTLIERAKELGLATGVVTTAYVSHATPGAFTAHQDSRHHPIAIADDQALRVRPDVLLGGGSAHFLPVGPGSLRDDAGLVAPLERAGYEVVFDAAGLAGAAASSGRLVGLFAPEHMDYVIDRPAASRQPRLAEMARAALAVLDRDPDGFLLVLEGARIDMASHGNDLARAIGETIDLDDTVAELAAWAEAAGDVTLIVTADHECGGLTLDSLAPAGVYPAVSWRWGQHTNARVALFGRGPGVEGADGAVRDFVWLHEVVLARLEGRAPILPARPMLADGRMDDLRHRVTGQPVATGFGLGYNQLDALWLDAGPAGLAIGIEGLFEWDENGVVVLIDRDLGAGTGMPGLRGAVSDRSFGVDALLAASPFTAPAVTGFGADLAVVSRGGGDPRLEDLLATSGLRGLVAPLGSADDLGWHPVAINFGEGVRSRDGAEPVPGEGLEVLIPWASVFPDGVPPGATLGVAVVLVNDDGGYASNQALPAFPSGTANPGRAVTALPGVVRFAIDGDRDGVIDGDAVPELLPAP
jgi:alkaline phosphatase